ncbi:hypothetical protein DFJ73DRAFT_814483 [Zopfochytrium polystomum]|nr:hypothetical protein DFJ73DRAFT_814483 [Zopfochytrium polystomum]
MPPTGIIRGSNRVGNSQIVVTQILALLAFLAVFAAAIATLPFASAASNPVYNPIPPVISYLDDTTVDQMYNAMDPQGEDFCLLNACTGVSTFVNQLFSTCNKSLTLLKPSKPPTIDEAKTLLSTCLCGKIDETSTSTYLDNWESCQNCYVLGFKPNPWTHFNKTMFQNACDCKEPGPVAAIVNVFNPDFKCTKLSVVRNADIGPDRPVGYGGSGGALPRWNGNTTSTTTETGGPMGWVKRVRRWLIGL